MLRGLFGSGGPASPGEAAIEQAAAAAATSAGAEGADGAGGRDSRRGRESEEKRAEYTRSASGFDPSGLERAAKAARELDRSPNASGALNLIQEQERTKQAELGAKKAEMQAAAKQMELERVSRAAEEQRRTLKENAEHSQQLEHYKDRLERKRQQDLLENQTQVQRMLQEEQRRKDEESLARQEAMRKKTLEYEAALRTQTETARAHAEADGRIRQERENRDIHRESMIESAKQYRETVLSSISAATSSIGAGLREFLSDRERMTAAVAVVSATALGVYSTRTAARVTGRVIEARLGKPSLIRDTSRLTLFQLMRRPLQALRKYSELRSADAAKVLDGIVLQPAQETRLNHIAVATQNARRNGAPYRNLLLHGPPGTGKTMFAKALARNAGMHYAILTGGDIAPLGRDAVTELHKVFDWANTSRRGLLVFVDEADAFLRSRTSQMMSEDLRSALNAFLYRTGEASDRFMLVYASNEPELFDWAATDRIDEVVEFDLPGQEERRRLVDSYFNKYIKQGKGIQYAEITPADLDHVAHATERFSGRDISKLAIAWQSAAYGSQGAILSRETLNNVLNAHLRQKAQKEAWMTSNNRAWEDSHLSPRLDRLNGSLSDDEQALSRAAVRA